MRKLKKLAARISAKIESVRDEMDDLEIEFELIQKHINKLESMPRNSTTSEEEVSIIVEEEEDDALSNVSGNVGVSDEFSEDDDMQQELDPAGLY